MACIQLLTLGIGREVTCEAHPMRDQVILRDETGGHAGQAGSPVRLRGQFLLHPSGSAGAAHSWRGRRRQPPAAGWCPLAHGLQIVPEAVSNRLSNGAVEVAAAVGQAEADDHTPNARIKVEMGVFKTSWIL